MIKNRIASMALVIPLCGLIQQAACGGEAGAPGVEVTSQELKNGADAMPWSPGGATEARPVLKVNTALGSCTGTLVQPSWVLTAGHCGLTSGAAGQKVQSYRASGAPVERTIDVAYTSPDRLDMALGHLTTPYTDIMPAPIYGDTNATLWNQTVNCYGFGATGSCSATVACPSGQTCAGGLCFDNAPKLRSGALIATKADYPATILNVPDNTLNQGILPGDSGGPCMRGGAVTSTHTTSGVDTSAVNLREWITTPSRTALTTGDFNGDGKTDVVVTTAAGSEWYYSTGKGTWNHAYSRPDLPLGKVAFTPGDFDGDGKTDLIITVSAGSFWYYGTETPGNFFIPDPILDAEFQLGKQHFVVGDFDGDHKDDFILVASVFEPRAGGSFWYYATTTRGTWNQAYSRPDLVLDNVSYVPGDFDGDGKTDLVIVTTGGSFWYFGTITPGTWDIPAALVRTDLVLGQVDYTTGNFDGAFGTDLIITVNTGSFWYFSTGGRSTWTIPAGAVRTDLNLGKVAFTAADFNGDGKSDMIVTTAADSRWYFSTGVGTWNQNLTKSTFKRSGVLFKTGNFDGDFGKKSDMVVTTTTGSFWYYSTGTGTFDQKFSNAAWML